MPSDKTYPLHIRWRKNQWFFYWRDIRGWLKRGYFIKLWINLLKKVLEVGGAFATADFFVCKKLNWKQPSEMILSKYWNIKI